jgi:hypothetical protein
MPTEPSFTKIKDGFFLVSSPEIQEYPWYLVRKHGQGTYAEIVKDIETGIYIAPWPFNKQIVVEEYSDPELRKMWDGSGILEIISLAHDEIIRQLAREKC